MRYPASAPTTSAASISPAAMRLHAPPRVTPLSAVGPPSHPTHCHFALERNSRRTEPYPRRLLTRARAGEGGALDAERTAGSNVYADHRAVPGQHPACRARNDCRQALPAYWRTGNQSRERAQACSERPRRPCLGPGFPTRSLTARSAAFAHEKAGKERGRRTASRRSLRSAAGLFLSLGLGQAIDHLVCILHNPQLAGYNTY